MEKHQVVVRHIFERNSYRQNSFKTTRKVFFIPISSSYVSLFSQKTKTRIKILLKKVLSLNLCGKE